MDSTTWQEVNSRCKQVLLALTSNRSIQSEHSQLSLQAALQPDFPPGRQYNHFLRTKLSTPLEENEHLRCSALMERADENLRRQVVQAYWVNVSKTNSMERFGGITDLDFQKALAEVYTNHYKRSEEYFVDKIVTAIETRTGSSRLSASICVDTDVSVLVYLQRQRIKLTVVHRQVYEQTLMAAFQIQRKPSTSEKQALADHLGVPLAKVSLKRGFATGSFLANA
jgi:hypothetical protein